jgi:hypothetical protein
VILTIRGKISWYSSWKLKGLRAREREMGFEVTEKCVLGVFFSLASAGSLLLSLLFFFSLDVSSYGHTAH